jgi:hypothetical protein
MTEQKALFEKIVTHLEKEFKLIQAETYINAAMYNEEKEKENFSIQSRMDFIKDISYKEGMYDAYQKIVDILHDFNKI